MPPRANDPLFVTYENRVNPHVVVHRVDCTQVTKHGGIRSTKQSGYQKHATFEAADAWARQSELPVVHCSLCNPDAKAKP